MKILFLDIDGVFTSTRTGWYNYDIHAVRFIRWVCKESGAKIVITSTWRKNHDKELFGKIFGQENLHEDWATEVLPRTKFSQRVLRGEEIQEWLNKHDVNKHYPVKYIIVDDDHDMLEWQIPCFVNTDTHNGLKFEDMDKIKTMFDIESFCRDDFPFPNLNDLIFQHS